MLPKMLKIAESDTWNGRGGEIPWDSSWFHQPYQLNSALSSYENIHTYILFPNISVDLVVSHCLNANCSPVCSTSSPHSRNLDEAAWLWLWAILAFCNAIEVGRLRKIRPEHQVLWTYTRNFQIFTNITCKCLIPKHLFYLFIQFMWLNINKWLCVANRIKFKF